MGDSVTTQILFDDVQRTIVLLTGVSDSTGEASVKKVDVSALSPVPDNDLRVEKIKYDVYGVAVELLWDASANVRFAALQGAGELDWSDMPVVNNAGAGKTGDILLLTAGAIAAAGDSYTITLYLRKN